jgi:hypothetical protein
MTATTTTATTALRRRPARVAALVAASAAITTGALLPQQAHATEPTTRATAHTVRADQTEKAKDAKDAKDAVEDGRGARYDENGRLIPIPHDDQPKPVPADDADIDKWIKQALKIMDRHDIPGTYEGIHRNLMRESSGDPYTINMWDTNAHENIPSKGLLQVIDPTFEQYHVEGTSNDPFDPVANIVAACNYAAHRYGTMDNVNSAY